MLIMLSRNHLEYSAYQGNVPKRYNGFFVIVHQFFEPVAQKLIAMKFNFASNSKLYRAPLLIHFPAMGTFPDSDARRLHGL